MGEEEAVLDVVAGHGLTVVVEMMRTGLAAMDGRE